MKPEPVIQSPSFHREKRLGAKTPPTYSVKLNIVWDEFTDVTLNVRIPGKTKTEAKAKAELTARRAERLARVIAGSAAYIDRLTRIVIALDNLPIHAFDEQHSGQSAKALMAIRDLVRGH